jgi:hypothetical protein
LVERNLAKVQVASSSLVSRSKSCFSRAGGAFALCGWLSAVCCADPVGIDDHGHSLGKVSTQGELIVLELDDRSTAPAELFDLSGRTLLFKREGSGYRVATGPLRWDSTYGPELTGSQVTLKNFTFPFSGRRWTSFFVGASGSIRFGVSEKDIGTDPYGHRDAGIVLDRFDELARVAGTLADRAPAISVFLKPRLSGRRYVKELADRVIITWDLTEPFGSILDYTWFRTVNRFQAVLARDGSIRMSYAQLAAKDAIVGVYPILPGTSRAVATRFSAVSSRDGPFEAVYQARPLLLPCSRASVGSVTGQTAVAIQLRGRASRTRSGAPLVRVCHREGEWQAGVPHRVASLGAGAAVARRISVLAAG